MSDTRGKGQLVLVSMPFMDALRPSIQLGLLKSLAVKTGFPAQTFHANLSFATQIGLDAYNVLAKHRGYMLGDWLFSLAAYPETAPDPGSRMLDEMSINLTFPGMSVDETRKMLIHMRLVEVPAYLDALLYALPWQEAAVVGFSSTFQQNAASFAFARRLKQLYPHISTLFGGANFDGCMGPEFVRTNDCIDVAVIGEADDSFPLALKALATGAELSAVPGVCWRECGEVKMTPPLPPVQQLDHLPVPDYDEYFERVEKLGIVHRSAHRKTWLPIETARGCWWGAKQHCTFCGLNAMSMSFRSKSPQRILDELGEQAKRYRSFHFEAVDNILDFAYMKTLLPELAKSQADYRLFYEVKANLGREQLKLMAQAGISSIQPGLESLSSHVLKLMRKGVRAAQNVNLLRWSLYYGIDVTWNLLWGFPGETEEDYAEQAAIVPHLLHLPPPWSADRIWLERFSPLFSGLDTSQVKHRVPERSYRYVYPRHIDLEKIAYFFDYELDSGLQDTVYVGLRRGIEEWRRSWDSDPTPALTYWSAPKFVQICDQRHPGQTDTFTFEGMLADLYLACSDRPTTAEAVRRKLDLSLPAEAVQEIFGKFQQRGLMFLDGELALSLALPAVRSR